MYTKQSPALKEAARIARVADRRRARAQTRLNRGTYDISPAPRKRRQSASSPEGNEPIPENGRAEGGNEA
jgi:hypothetical protein